MPTIIVRLSVKPEREQDFLDIFREVSERVKAQEPECTLYETWKTTKPHEYYHLVSYETQAARDRHAELNTDVGPRFLPCLAEEPKVEDLGDKVLGLR